MKMSRPLLLLSFSAAISTFAFVAFPDSTPLNPRQPATPIPPQVVQHSVQQNKIEVHPAYRAIRREKQKAKEKPVAQISQQQGNQPVLQVAFVLDVTGSMSGLIHTAREKIWSIATSLTQTQPAPKIEIGLVAYRDRGDAFVTKVTELSEDIDMVYADLMALSADGGGDEPESVNAGLYDAVSKLDWDNEKCTYRAIFLVGDCPPHMDYTGDVLYTESCEKAHKKGIFINTIQMGDNPGTSAIWNDISRLGGGDYIQVGMDAGGLTFTTPYDADIAKASLALEDTRMYFGTRDEIKAADKKVAVSKSVSGMASPAAAAERAVFNMSDAGTSNLYGNKELINSIAEGEIEMDDIPEEELPVELRTVAPAMRKEVVMDKLEERKATESSMKSLITKREEYITNNISTSAAGNSINTQIFQIVQKQASRCDITLTGKAKQ